MKRRLARFVLLTALALGAGGPRLRAHPASLTAAELRVTADGSVRLGVDFDALAYAIDDDPVRIPQQAYRAALSASPAGQKAMRDEAIARWQAAVRLEADGIEVPLGPWLFPPTAALFEAPAPGAPRLPALLEASATTHLAPGAHRLRVRFPDVIGQVILTTQPPVGEAAVAPVDAGGWSAAEEVSLQETARAGWLEASARFVGPGFRHIVPGGLDHILFVLGLFLLGGGARALLKQVTAFTVAHSITLGLSLYGVVRLSPSFVEPCIALSIVLIAVDNLRARRPERHRLALIFGFGLIHGLGFSTALRDLGLPRDRLATALVGFNAGIELGQLAVIAAAFLLVGWLCRHRAAYRRLVVVPASIAIGGVALVWTVQRLGR